MENILSTNETWLSKVREKHYFQFSEIYIFYKYAKRNKQKSEKKSIFCFMCMKFVYGFNLNVGI